MGKNLFATLHIPGWELSFGGGTIEVFGDALLFYFVALFILILVGGTASTLLLPDRLRRFGWMLVPSVGYSVLAIWDSWFISLGGNVGTGLIPLLVACTGASVWGISRHPLKTNLGSPRWILLLVALSLPSYLVTAISMAHNGTLAYVGGNGDLELFVPVTEWLKTRAAPLLSLNAFPPFNPEWSSSIPPPGNWIAPSAHLGTAVGRANDIFFAFQRGPRYLESSLGIILGWDAYRVFRPAQAFMLSLAVPSVFLFAYSLVRASMRSSLLAALVFCLNGTVFFWVQIGHPGQAAWAFLLPVAALFTILAVDSTEKRTLVAAATLLASLLISYYQGSVMLAALLAPCLAWMVLRTSHMRGLIRLFTIAVALLVLALPEHTKLLLGFLSGNMFEPTGWGSPGFGFFGDPLGTTLIDSAFEVVAGQGQLSQSMLHTYGLLGTASTILALIIGGWSLVTRSGKEATLFRLMFLGSLMLLLALRVLGYAYGYAKAQAVLAFVFSVALGMGMDQCLRLAGRAARKSAQFPSALWKLRVAALLPVLLVLSMAGLNLSLSAYAYWKPVGNMWNPRLWDASALASKLPVGNTVRLSPSALVDPEVLWMTFYFLRNQIPQGPYSYHASVATGDTGLPESRLEGSQPPTSFELLGASEVAAARGLTTSDLVWRGSLMQAYSARDPRLDPRAFDGAATTVIPVSLRRGRAIDLDWAASSPKNGAASGGGTAILTFAADAPSTVRVATADAEHDLSIEVGVSIRSIPIGVEDRVRVTQHAGGEPLLLSAHLRERMEGTLESEDYPRSLTVAGHSVFDGDSISARLAYLNVGVPASHSLDVYDTSGTRHVGWFQLPTNPDDRLKDIQIQLNASTLEQTLALDGVQIERRSSIQPPVSGEYFGYFSIEYGAAKPVRIPIFRYRLDGGRVVEFEDFGLLCVWDGRSELSNWR